MRESPSQVKSNVSGNTRVLLVRQETRSLSASLWLLPFLRETQTGLCHPRENISHGSLSSVPPRSRERGPWATPIKDLVQHQNMLEKFPH